MSDANRILPILGAKNRINGRPSSRGFEAAQRLRRGLPISAAQKAMAYFDLQADEVATLLGISRRALARRGPTKRRLTPAQSDRLYRFVRIGVLVEEVFANRQDATRWLRRPERALGRVAPIELLDTDAGAQEVEKLLARIEHGIVT